MGYKNRETFSVREYWDTYEALGARRAPSWRLVAVTAAPAPPASEASPAPTRAAGYLSPARRKDTQIWICYM